MALKSNSLQISNVKREKYNLEPFLMVWPCLSKISFYELIIDISEISYIIKKKYRTPLHMRKMVRTVSVSIFRSDFHLQPVCPSYK